MSTETSNAPFTDFSSFACPKEGRLKRAEEVSAGFRADARVIRAAVARGTFTPEYGVSTMKHEGGLSPKQEEQLTLCLGRIAAGKCPSYPLINAADFSFSPEQ